MYDAQENFEYRLVPLRKDVPDISRRTRPGDNPINGNGDETVEATYFQYPFDTFPPVISKAKPHFVVCDTGRKLDLHYNRYDGTASVFARIYGVPLEKAKILIDVVRQPYRTWVLRVIPDSFVSSPRKTYSNPRCGLITFNNLGFASPLASCPDKRLRISEEAINSRLPEQYVDPCAADSTDCTPDALDLSISGNSRPDAEVDEEVVRM